MALSNFKLKTENCVGFGNPEVIRSGEARFRKPTRCYSLGIFMKTILPRTEGSAERFLLKALDILMRFYQL